MNNLFIYRAIDILILENKSFNENDEYIWNRIKSYYNDRGISDLIFEKSENGKSFIKNRNDLFFNISHADKKTVVAFFNENIGIDIEEEKVFNKKIIEKFYSVNEKKEIEKAGELKNRKAVEIWTRKEAACKYSGEGISVRNLSADTNLLNDVEINTVNIDKYIISVCIKKETGKSIKINILK